MSDETLCPTCMNPVIEIAPMRITGVYRAVGVSTKRLKKDCGTCGRQVGRNDKRRTDLGTYSK